MFKNIQKQLLLKYPLLWNTKFIPMLLIGIAMNIIYFLIGFYDGTLDFTGEYIYGDNEDEVLGFGFLFATIILLIWFWFYSKNNSFKSFYVKSKNALFFEFFQVLIILVLFFNFFFFYKIGEQLHHRSYFSYEKAKSRCEIIGLADIFIDGSYATTELDSVKMGMIYKDSLKNEEVYNKCLQNETVYHKNYVVFDENKYNEYSLINRISRKFEINSYKEDSIACLHLKRNIINNKNEVLNFMSSYLNIVKEHNLNTNLDESTWYNLTIKNSNFTNSDLIFPYSYNIENQKNKGYYTLVYFDEFDNVAKKYIFTDELKDSKKKYSKFYVEHHLLQEKYGIISNSYTSRYFRLTELLIINCFAFMLAVFIFTFRISKLKNWFISIVVFGVLAILFGIIANIINNEDLFFPLFSIISMLLFWGYYFIILKNQKSKKYSEIILNLCVWSVPMLIPFLYFFADEFHKDFIFKQLPNVSDPIRKAFRENISTMFSINFFISLLLMFFLSRTIRTWKGISEE